LLGQPAVRWVLIAYPPGHVSVPHHHPHAVEAFLVYRGRGVFTIGDRDFSACEGTLLWAAAGVEHTIKVSGPDALVFLASVAPNENRADETVEN